jgi:hypothetical protein
MADLKVYVDIHAILDTTLVLAESINKVIGERLDVYTKRPNNKFSGLMHNDKFQKEWTARARDIDITKCRSTPYVHLLNKLITTYKNLNVNGVSELNVTVHLNMYPIMTTRTNITLITDMLAKILNVKSVKDINLSPSMFNVDAIKSYNHVIMYNFDDWLNMHIDDLIKKPIPDVELTTPLIAKDELKGLTVEEAVEKVEQFLMPMLGVKLLPLSMFSIEIK